MITQAYDLTTKAAHTYEKAVEEAAGRSNSPSNQVVREEMRLAQKAAEKVVRTAVKTAEKTAKKAIKAAEKTARKTVKTAEKTVREGLKTANKAIEKTAEAGTRAVGTAERTVANIVDAGSTVAIQAVGVATGAVTFGVGEVVATGLDTGKKAAIQASNVASKAIEEGAVIAEKAASTAVNVAADTWGAVWDAADKTVEISEEICL